MILPLRLAQSAISAALAHARDCGAKPLAVIVLDAGGHPVAFAREEGASLFRFDIARAKAHGALGMGADTRDVASRAANNPGFFMSVVVATGGQLALSAGGVLIRDSVGSVIGSIGISGDASEVDEACAIAGAVIFSEGGPSEAA